MNDAPGGERAAILVVDDRPSNLKALETTLAKPDYDLVIASSGEEALASVLRRDFAVIVLDVAMPRMTGFEVAETLKQRERSCRVPIIFVTASVYDMENLYRAYDVGAVDCLRKPVDPHELRSKVGVFVELYRQKKQIERQGIRIREAEMREQRLLLARAEAALVESETLYQLTFEEAPVGIGQADPEGRLIRVNERLSEILRAPPDALLGRAVHEIAGDAEAEALASALEAVRSGSARVHTSEHELCRAPGPPIWVNLTVSALRDADRAITRFILVMDDVTPRKRLEVDRGRLVAELREGIRARDDFLTIAAHELKTPVTPLRLLTQSLLRDLNRCREACPPDALANRLQRLDASTERIEGLVDRLLDASRISLGRLVLSPEDVDLPALVREAIAKFTAEGAIPTPRLTVGPGPIVGCWDRVRIEQVVLNLLSNALKYGRDRPIEVEIEAKDGMARLVVRDHGIGIPEEAQDRIFERFERAAPIRHYGGFGLGLWIVRRVVEAHDGAITVRSRPGEGSEFTVELPLRPADTLCTRSS